MHVTGRQGGLCGGPPSVILAALVGPVTHSKAGIWYKALLSVPTAVTYNEPLNRVLGLQLA